MQYRKFGRTSLSPSILGFGMMRMPKNEDGSFDEKWTVDTLRYAIDRGLSYVDTAYIYGDSERVTGIALQDGYREKVTLATKIPVIRMTCPEDFERMLNEQLARLQTDHIDMYLLHGLNRNSWDNFVVKYDVLAHAERAIAAGKIRHLGFSFHDDLEAFRYILNSYDNWAFCQIQLNYMDVNYQAGLQGLREAHEKGLAVVIMEPLRGGTLANVPEDIANILPGRPVETALRFLWDREEVNVILSGMNTMEQVQENLSLAESARPGMLTEQEKTQILAAGDKMRQKLSIPCTSCDYCSVCPNGIAIPKIFALYNQMQLDGSRRGAQAAYKALDGRDGAKCVSCGVCTEQCPQHINIPEKLKTIHDRLV